MIAVSMTGEDVLEFAEWQQTMLKKPYKISRGLYDWADRYPDGVRIIFFDCSDPRDLMVFKLRWGGNLAA